MKRYWFGVALVLAAGLVVGACTPRAAPAPPPPAPAAAPVPAPAPQAPPQDEAWAKIVEAAKKEGSVMAYGATGLCCEWGQAVAKAFKEKYGITLEILSISGRQAVEKTAIERQIKQHIVDFVQTGVSSATEIYTRGLTVSIASELPVLRDKSAFHMDPLYSPDGQVLNLSQTVSTILVNDKVKPEDYPRSYRDFLHPKWQGKIILTDPRARGGGGFQMFSTHLFYKTAVNEDFWRELMKNKPALWTGSNVESYKMVGRGEYLMDITGGGTSSAPLIAEGAPMRGDLTLEEGTVYQGYLIEVIKDPPHPNATKLLFNWLFSKEGQDVYAKASARPPLRKDVPNYLTARSRTQPKRILERNWDAALFGDKLEQRYLEEIFGKR